MINKHKGSSFQDFLKEENLLNDAQAVAIKRVIAYQLKKTMLKEHITKSTMATRLRTSRTGLERLLDPVNTSVTLRTLVRAAQISGKRIQFMLR